MAGHHRCLPVAARAAGPVWPSETFRIDLLEICIHVSEQEFSWERLWVSVRRRQRGKTEGFQSPEVPPGVNPVSGRGGLHKAKADSFYFSVTFQQQILTFVTVSDTSQRPARHKLQRKVFLSHRMIARWFDTATLITASLISYCFMLPLFCFLLFFFLRT